MTRDDLKNYRYIHKWVTERLQYLTEYKTTIEKMTSTLSDMPMGGKQVQDSMAEKISILLDNINEMFDKVLEESKKQKEILNQLDQVEHKYREILDLVYIQGYNLVYVANELHYNYKWTCEMHGIALNKYDELDKNRTKTVENG